MLLAFAFVSTFPKLDSGSTGKKEIILKMVERDFSAFLARDVTEFLLKEGNIRINGYTHIPLGRLSALPRKFDSEDLHTARERLTDGCRLMRSSHGREIVDMCARLNLEDAQLYSNFHTILSNIWAKPENWGRLVSLFVATAAVAERLYHEDESKVETVIRLFEKFLVEKVVPWIRQRGGYVSQQPCCCSFYGTCTLLALPP